MASLREPLVQKSGQLQQLQSGDIADIGYDVHGFKNKIINGSFKVWQRGTSTTSSAVYLADRWKNSFNGTGITRTDSQQSFGVNGGLVSEYAPYFFRAAITGTITGATTNQLQQVIESVEMLQGKTVTVSYWAKADASRNITVDLIQTFGTGGSPSANVDTGAVTQAITTTWTRYSTTFTLGSTSGKTFGTNGDDGLILRFVFPLNTACTIDLFGVQVEESQVKTGFEERPFSIEELLCYRYAKVLGPALGGVWTDGTQFVCTPPLIPVMRATPTATLSQNNPQITTITVTTSTGSSSTVTISTGGNGSTKLGIGLFINGFTGQTRGTAGFLTVGTVTLNAEL